MIRDPKDFDDLVLDIVMKNGDLFIGRDTTTQPLGDHCNVVAFWEQGSIRVIPMADVESVTMREKASDAEYWNHCPCLECDDVCVAVALRANCIPFRTWSDENYDKAELWHKDGWRSAGQKAGDA